MNSFIKVFPRAMVTSVAIFIAIGTLIVFYLSCRASYSNIIEFTNTYESLNDDYEFIKGVASRIDEKIYVSIEKRDKSIIVSAEYLTLNSEREIRQTVSEKAKENKIKTTIAYRFRR